MKRMMAFWGLLGLGCTADTISDSGVSEEDVEIENDWTPDEEGGCPESWVLTYGISGRVDITHTPLNIGNADALVGGLETDEIVLRFADDGGVPADGQVLMTYFELVQDFQVSVNMWGEIAIITDLLSLAEDECGLASAELDGSSLTWDDCSFGAEHGSTRWSPNEGAFGPGCVSDYHVEGIVECVDDSVLASCSDGWLDEGENVLDYVYEQPMLSFDFDGPDLDRFTMIGSDYGTELPTFTNNRTWLSLEGELKSMSLEPTPDCLCTE